MHYDESNGAVESMVTQEVLTKEILSEVYGKTTENVNESNSFTKGESIEGDKDSIRKDVKRKIEELIKIADSQIEKARKEKDYILRAARDCKEGMEQLVQSACSVYEYKLITNPAIETMKVQYGPAIIYFDKMDICIIGDGLEVQLNHGDEPVGMLYLTSENKVEFDKEEWVLKIA